MSQNKEQALVVTLSGATVDLLNLDVHAIPFSDIAHTLSVTRRFFGQIKDNYTVALHSVNAARLAQELYPDNPEFAKIAFCHEFAETLFGDMSSPLKYSAPLAGYMFLEKQAMKLFYMRFCKVSIQPQEVSNIDNLLLLWESFFLNRRIYDKIVNNNNYQGVSPESLVQKVVDAIGLPIAYDYNSTLNIFNNTYKELFGDVIL